MTEFKADRKRVLLMGEGVSSAHVMRPLGLAIGLQKIGYDVVFACDPRYRHMVVAAGVDYTTLPSNTPATFLKRVYWAERLYKEDELRQYVRSDLRAIAAAKPDVVVGDFRLSLGISAELCDIPHIALSNLHWSPSAKLPCPVPEHPMTKIFGVGLTRLILQATLPMYFAVQMKPFNIVRKGYGLPEISGRGAHEVFTRGTRTLYLDIPQLYEVGPLSEKEDYIGPINWTPDVPLPEWWEELPKNKPVVFVTPGSTGDVRATRLVVETLASMDVSVMVATAGRMDPQDMPENAYAAEFIPGKAAAQRSTFVVFNGGSGMVYQALACGTPIMGIPSNMDQYYVMEAVDSRGAGRLLRAGTITRRLIRKVADQLLYEPAFWQAARRLQSYMAGYDPVVGLSAVIDQISKPFRPPRMAEKIQPGVIEANRSGAQSRNEGNVEPVDNLAALSEERA